MFSEYPSNTSYFWQTMILKIYFDIIARNSLYWDDPAAIFMSPIIFSQVQLSRFVSQCTILATMRFQTTLGSRSDGDLSQSTSGSADYITT